jgi:xanthine dehydrogenase YagR molybdenum-binding subunit
MRRFYFHASMSCAATRQTLRMDADNDGKLTALDHRTKTTSSTFDVFC